MKHDIKIKDALVEVTKFRNPMDVLSFIEELDLIPVEDEKKTSSRIRKQSNRRNSWHVY